MSRSRSGSFRIKDFTVPIGVVSELRGAISTYDTGQGNRFGSAPDGIRGVFAQADSGSPGGLLGIHFSLISGIRQYRDGKKACRAHPRITRTNFDLAMLLLPIKPRASPNILLAALNCKIGSEFSSPVQLKPLHTKLQPMSPCLPGTDQISGKNSTFTSGCCSAFAGVYRQRHCRGQLAVDPVCELVRTRLGTDQQSRECKTEASLHCRQTTK